MNKLFFNASFLLAIIFLISSCQNKSEEYQAFSRANDPWIARSVLDTRPRMISLALHNDLWAAYSTENCALYKVWKGYVNYEGAVFNLVHGPQPVTIGNAYLENSHPQPWEVRASDTPVDTKVRYEGHRIRNGKVELLYSLIIPANEPIQVVENPEYLKRNGQMGFARKFTISNLPEHFTLKFKTNLSSISNKGNIESNIDYSVLKSEAVELNGRKNLNLDLELIFPQNGEYYLNTYFLPEPTIPNPNKVDKELENRPLGERLIARNDCKTCHATNVKTIGPSYLDIAERYPNSDDMANKLAQKIIQGGSGIWGTQAMSPHPELPVTDAKEISRYILSLDNETISASTSEKVAGQFEALDPSESEGTIPGAFVTVYLSDKPLKNLQPKPAGRPYMGGVMSNFDNIDANDFKDLGENFSLYSEGFINIPETKKYVFRLWSDDGSAFYLHDQKVIDHDGSHSTSSKEIILQMEKGMHPFNLTFFQGLGGKFLSLNWKPEGADAFEVIPPEAYSHKYQLHSTIEGLTLPMSAIKRTPGDQYLLTDGHPSFTIEQARPDDFLPKVGGMDFLSDGRLVISTWDALGAVYIIDNASSGDPAKMKVKKIADGLAEPLGLKVVNDTIYVLQKQELTQLIDNNGDEIIDEYRNICNSWNAGPNFHEFAFGLEYQDGYFYGNLSIAIEPGGASTQPQLEGRGSTVKISRTGELTYVANGLRVPNGIGYGIDGELFITDNQGDWLPCSKLLHITQDAFFGSRAVDFAGTEGIKVKQPVLWLPQDEIGNSPTIPLYLDKGPYAGQMIHGEVTNGGIKRDFIEKVNGEYQGCVFRFVQGLEAGVNRLRWGPDGALYVGGIGNSGNWNQTGKLWYGLQKLTYNEKPCFEMLAVRAKSNGLEIEFTEALREGDGWDTKDYEVRQWHYVPTAAYGGPKVDEENLEILSANVSSDRKKVFLELEGMRAGKVLYLHMLDQYTSAAGRQMRSTEAWYTMNNIPLDKPGIKTTPTMAYGPNVLTAEEKQDGWQLLFDGESIGGWRNYRKQTIGQSWVVDDGAIHLKALPREDGSWQAADGGDIITEGKYENFELTLEWKIANCGNSGIIFGVAEDEKYDYVWQTGPEMQVLDNSCHPDARFRTHKAGDLYDLLECSYTTVKPAGQWNKVRLIKNKGHLEHWLNGVKVVETEIGTKEWDKMVAASKFGEMEGFGKFAEGHIALQDHGDRVWFRDIKIRELGQ